MPSSPFIDERPDVVGSFLTDAAHMPGGHATGVAFPRTIDDVSALVAGAGRVLPIGAQSSLTGGATPRGDLVLSTRALTGVSRVAADRVRVGAGVPLAELQRHLSTDDLYYPPVPTYDGAFLGGTVATNAAGAATFKYGATRQWVEALTVVLADGSVLSIARGAIRATPDGWFAATDRSWPVARVPVPAYVMPDVPKLSAGYYARPEMDLVDLFIGSEGTLGVIVDATIRVVARRPRVVALVRCTSERQAVTVAGVLRHEALAAWAGRGPLDVAAIELMDRRALAVVSDDAFTRARIARPHGDEVCLLLQIEVSAGEDAALHRLHEILDASGVRADPELAVSGDARGAERLFELREAVPAAVNRRVAEAQANVHPGIHKTAGDMIVPFARLDDSLALYREAFERRGLDYAVWGHASDGNLHPNVVPRSLDDVERGEEALLEIARSVAAMGGAPLAEHGVGRSSLKQRMLLDLYGPGGIDSMRAVKRALDPEWKLAAGVIFPALTEAG